MPDFDLWFPFYPERFAADTTHLTLEQECIYRRLIDWYMINARPLPESAIARARIAGVDELTLSNTWGILQVYYEYKPGIGWVHNYCEKMLGEMYQRAERRREKAKNAINTRWKKYREKQEHNTTSNTTSNTPAYYPYPDNRRDMSYDTPLLNGGAREESFNNSQKPSVEIAARFDEFFTRYPANGSPRTPAFHAYEAALKEGATHDRIIAKLAEYLEYCSLTATRTCHAATWLRDKRFEVDYEAAFATWSAAQAAGKPAHSGVGGKSERWRRGFAAAIAEVIE